MKRGVLQSAEKYRSTKKKKQNWYGIVACLACVVMFCTAYALILPAITMEKARCELTEHVHSEDCYNQITSVQKTALVCDAERLNLHRHTQECYGEDGSLTCGYADFVVHRHDSYCYDENGTLWCTLPEVSTYAHSDSCYVVPEAEEPHVHTEACYNKERGELICTEHVHSDDCRIEVTVLICGMESDGHQHEESCLDENGEIVCEMEASEGHHHDDSCYEIQQEMNCGVDSDHQHSDECYAWNQTLICELSTEPIAVEPVLVCGREEVILHEHDASCRDASGSLICGKPQVLAHQHTDACFETVEELVDMENLTCTLSEDENHTHTFLCYGTWELTCDKEEHIHTKECGIEEEMDLYVSGVETCADSVMTAADLSDATETTGSLDVNTYIQKATLFYRTDDASEWVNVDGAEQIPGNAQFKLAIEFGNVSIDALLNADGKMTYHLPELLRNAKANGSITSGNTAVGTIDVDGGKVTLGFDTQWLSDMKKNNNTVISGDFFVEAEADLSKVEQDKPGEIQVGSTTIKINFDGDIVAKYGNVELSKTVSAISEEEDGDYLTYTLTVKAGVDGCPNVKVVDCFADTTYIERYIGVTGVAAETNDTDGPIETGGTGSVYIGEAPTEEKPIPDPAAEKLTLPGTLVWVIGDMKADEIRTLTYKVKLVDSYTGIHVKDNLQNTANVYSETYQRDSDTVTFTPKAAATMSKVASKFTPDEKGGGKIVYTIWVHADENNSYVLDNVKIVDALDGSIENRNGTLEAIRKYLSYDEESFHLYEGGSDKQDGSSGLTESKDGSGPTFKTSNNDTRKNGSFTYYVGALAPGESKTLTYTVNVEPGVFMAGNEDFYINNRACIYTDDNRNDGNEKLNGFNTNKSMDRKVWSRKLVGEKQETETTVSMSGSVYDSSDGSINNPGSFIVPAGSYQYQVVANEAGDWDLSSAAMKDSLGSQYMQFVGYVRVDAYTIEDHTAASGLDDAATAAKLSSRTPNKTVWVKVDGQKSFEFTPEQIGFDGNQAYLLTYYAKPMNIAGITQVQVGNSFNISGTVGIGGYTYTLTGIEVNASVVVEGDNSFAAEKQSWYYEAPKVTDGDFANGALYWVMKVDGKVLPLGTAIKDITNVSGGTAHYIHNTSFMGVYMGNLGAKSLADYADLDALTADRNLTALESDTYSVETGNEFLTLTLKKELHLDEGNSLYLIVKTEPSKLPESKRDAIIYNNKLQSSSDSTNWLDHNVASKTLYGSENIFKELGRVFTYSNNTITVIQEGTKQAIDTGALNGAGTYAAWQIHVNYEGSLSGRYRVVEQIPDGMEVTYVRMWWLGNKANQQAKKPTFVQLSSEELNALGGGWIEHRKTMSSNNAGNCENYYYTNGQQVIWDIDNLVAGGGTRDDYAVEIQIVCRVTDPEVLLGGKSKEFNNEVSLQNSAGITIGNDGNGVTIGKQTLSKTGTYDSKINGGRYPFKITLNELGEDLVSGTDTITLVDELSTTLILDTSSIKVVNTKTGEKISDWISSVVGQTLKIVLPDNLPLIITYEATVNAAPGQVISISNNAHWEGYTTPSGGSVEVKEFHYSTGGTVGVSETPSVTIKKLDQYTTSQFLSDAEFKLVEVNDDFTETKDGLSLSGTTGADGTLTFGKSEGKLLKYNTIYCLIETKAPEGYVLDAAPHYFAVAEQVDEEYPEFPEGVTVWYQSANYTYQAYNHKGEAEVRKTFLNAGDDELEKVNGTYRFGIYTEANPTGTPLQTVSITYAKDKVEQTDVKAKFTNLELGKTYYIYELDDSNQPIMNNVLAMVNKSGFIVTYPNGSQVTIPSDGSSQNPVTVTNQVCYPELPDAGGTGANIFYVLSLIFVIGAAVLLVIKKQFV